MGVKLVPSRPDNLIPVKDNGRFGVFDKDSNKFFGLDVRFFLVWNFVDGERDAREIAEKMAEESDYDADLLEGEVRAVIRHLVHKGLLVMKKVE